MATPAQPPNSGKPEYDAGHVPMSEELDSARWTLPPIVPVLIALLLVGAAVAVFVYSQSSSPATTGQLTNVFAVEEPGGRGTVVMMHFKLANNIDKPLIVNSVQAWLYAKGQEMNDIPASVSDIERILQAYPELAQHRITPWKGEDRLSKGESKEGMIIVRYPLAKADFDSRQWISAHVRMYDRTPLELKQSK